jgi:hypothetical protein
MFTVEEIAVLCNVSRDVVTKVRRMLDGPFCLNKCRPEWFSEWMREHPDFQLTKDDESEPKRVPSRNPRKRLPCVTLSKRFKRLKPSQKSLAVVKL